MATLDGHIFCVSCSHSLSGADLDGACPLCGVAVKASVELSVIDPADLTVATDLLCAQCGYNLRTLSIGSRCPECGQEVVISLRPRDLRFAPFDWLTRLRMGAIMLLLAHVGPVVFVLGLAVAALGGVCLSLFAVLATPALLLMGLACISEPRPDRPEPQGRRDLRAVVVVLALATVVVGGLGLVAQSPVMVILAAALGSGAAVAAMVAIFRLAKATADDILATLAGLTAATLAVWMVILALIPLAPYPGDFVEGLAPLFLIWSVFTYLLFFCTMLAIWQRVNTAIRRRPTGI